MNFRNGLRLNFSVNKLIEILRKNREEHAAIFEEANGNYNKSLMAELKQKVADLESGKSVNPNSSLSTPNDNLNEYDTAISMLELTVSREVELTQDQYHAYVLDKWSWQSSFLNTASTYSVLAGSKLKSINI